MGSFVRMRISLIRSNMNILVRKRKKKKNDRERNKKYNEKVWKEGL